MSVPHHRHLDTYHRLTMKIVVTGSIAFDYLMSFPGKFTEHLLPEHMHRVSLSFLVDTMDKRRGGCAPNIAYTLALLGERPLLMATAGQDFGDYRAWLEAAGIDTSLVKSGRRQVHRVVLLQHRPGATTRSRRSIPARWPTPASCRSGPCRDCRRLAIISPNDPGAMVQYAEECRTLGIRYIFDPGQQCARMAGDELRDGVTGADMVIVNDYELELLRQKTGLDEAGILQQAKALVVTRGENGCSVLTREGARSTFRAVAARAHRRSDRRRRRVPRRADEGDGDWRLPYEICARTGQRRRDLCARAPRRHRATPTAGRSSSGGTKRISARSRCRRDGGAEFRRQIPFTRS